MGSTADLTGQGAAFTPAGMDRDVEIQGVARVLRAGFSLTEPWLFLAKLGISLAILAGMDVLVANQLRVFWRFSRCLSLIELLAPPFVLKVPMLLSSGKLGIRPLD